MTSSAVAIAIALLSLLVSAFTFWLIFFHRGRVRMTLPTQISFIWPERDRAPIVFVLGLLYCTAKRGAVVESLYVRIRRGEAAQNFNVWVFGEQQLARGGGLFVGQEGVAYRHYFFPPADGSRFEFLPGTYTLQVFASVVGRGEPSKVAEVSLSLPQELAQAPDHGGHAVTFDWGPDSGAYHAHVPAQPGSTIEEQLERVMQQVQRMQS